MDEGYIKGAVGVSAKALFFSYSKELLTGRLNYYPYVGFEKSSRFEALEEGNYVIDRTVTKRSGNWNASTKSYGFGSVTTLQEDAYGDAAPQIIKTKDVTMVVFTADIAGRITGNHTAIVYSIYDEAAGTWSAPTIIEDDQTADFCPDVTTDGTNIYVAWMNTKDASFTQDAAMSEVGASCEIVVAKWNAGTQSFETDTLTNNAFVDMRPKLAISNGDVYAAWISNSDNDLLIQQGTNTINYAVKQNDKWSAYEVASYQHNAVVGLDIGEIGNEIHLAYALDVDGDIATTDDVEIYTSALGGTAQALTNNGSYEQNIQYVSINGKNAFMWFADGKLLYSDDLFQTVELTSEEDMVASSDYSIVNGDAADMLITAYGEGDGRDLYAYLIEDSMLTAPVKITGLEGYAAKANGYSEGGDYHLVFTRTDETIQKDTMVGSTDICTAIITKEHNMTLQNVSFNPDDVAAGSTLPLTCTIKNSGLNDEAAYIISASTTDGEIFQEAFTQSIPVGESAEAEISLPLPGGMPMGTEVMVQVQPQNAVDCDSTDNSYVITLGMPELKLTAEKTVTDTSTAITAAITNTSSYDTAATLVIKNTDADGAILKTYHDIAVAQKDSSVIEISKETVAEIADVGDSLYLEVYGPGEENFYSDNYAILYIDGGKVKQITLSQSDLNMQKGTSAVLAADIQPGQLSDIGVNWTSSNEEAAKVDANGKVSAVSKGTAVITATANDGSEIEKSCNVTVSDGEKPVKVSGVTLEPTKHTMEAGGEVTLTATVMPETAANKNVTWSSSNAKVTSVDRNGVVRAVSAGTVVITVTTVDGNKKASCQITVTAKPIQKYSVSLDAMGGKVSPNAISVEAGKEYGALPTPIRDGYTFLGWYTEKNGGSKVGFVTKVTAANDHSLYARWIGVSCRASYDANGGTISAKYKNVVYGDTYGDLPVPTRKYYSFTGWYTAKTGGSKVTSASKVSQGNNHILYARWIGTAYKVSYNANGGKSSAKSKLVNYGSTYGQLSAPMRKGYKFKGWYTSKKSGKKVTPATRFTTAKNITLYARWDKISVKKVVSIQLKNKKSKQMTGTIKRVKGIKGYQIVYGLNKSVTNGKKSFLSTSTKFTINKLKKGRTYYVKARGYAVDSAGKKVYGSYSPVKSLKLKK